MKTTLILTAVLMFGIPALAGIAIIAMTAIMSAIWVGDCKIERTASSTGLTKLHSQLSHFVCQISLCF